MSVAGAPPPDEEPTDAAAGGRREPDQAEVDAAFAALVAGWDDPAPQRPDHPAPDVSAPDVSARPAPPEPIRAPEDIAAEDTAEDTDQPDDADEGHFEPPEPPALPRLSARALGGLALVAAGITLLVAPGVLGLTDGAGLPLGLLVAAAGLAVLLSRLRRGPDPDSDWDDGARL